MQPTGAAEEGTELRYREEGRVYWRKISVLQGWEGVPEGGSVCTGGERLGMEAGEGARDEGEEEGEGEGGRGRASGVPVCRRRTAAACARGGRGGRRRPLPLRARRAAVGTCTGGFIVYYSIL